MLGVEQYMSLLGLLPQVEPAQHCWALAPHAVQLLTAVHKVDDVQSLPLPTQWLVESQHPLVQVDPAQQGLPGVQAVQVLAAVHTEPVAQLLSTSTQ
jgi:hypothetical protein